MPQPLSQQYSYLPQHLSTTPIPRLQVVTAGGQMVHVSAAASPLVGTPGALPPPPGRRSIRLRLVEERRVPLAAVPGRSILDTFRKAGRARTRSMSDVMQRTGFGGMGGGGGGRLLERGGGDLRQLPEPDPPPPPGAAAPGLVERGSIRVSWYDGTGTAELSEHVRGSVRRKLGLGRAAVLEDVRVIDVGVEPQEEVVLCPYLPDGASFLLRFALGDGEEAAAAAERNDRDRDRAADSHCRPAPPDSPSAAPSPHPSSLNLLQLREVLSKSGLVTATPPLEEGSRPTSAASSPRKARAKAAAAALAPSNGLSMPELRTASPADRSVTFEQPPPAHPDGGGYGGEGGGEAERGRRKGGRKGEQVDKVQDALRQLNDLLGHKVKNRNRRQQHDREEEKKRVLFVLANYFVLFLSVVAISAEIHERSPKWMEWVQNHVDSVNNCSKDSDALYACVTEGNFAGLIASITFWITQSAFTSQLLLFGFDSRQKLWTVVYEAVITAMCWGASYIFIRRGLNPDTRTNFIQKYWKDAVYGSLAGFNAAFLKAILKNLLPQDQVLDALETRQLRVVDWISRIFNAAHDPDLVVR